METNADVVPPTAWTSVVLGLPQGYTGGEATDINDAGVVTGLAYGSAGGEPFIWSAADGFRRLPTTSNRPAGATRAINNKGFTVGQISGPQSGVQPAVWGPGGSHIDVISGLDSTNNQWAHDINDNGEVVGEGMLTWNPFTWVGYRWTRQKGMEILPTLGGIHSAAYAINASGVIVGVSSTPNSNNSHPTMWSPSLVPTDLGSVPGADATHPVAINSAGVVVGDSYVFTFTRGFNFVFTPVVWHTPGNPELLRLPPGAREARVVDIDDLGWIYGLGYMPHIVPVVWSPAGVPRILKQTTLPARASQCGKIAARWTGTAQWTIWDRAC
jgi:hypothetical protein